MQESTAMVAVKQERPDEAEIQALAEQLKEANKAKMAAPTRTGMSLIGTTGQTTISLAQRNTTNNAQAASTTKTAEDKKPIDEESQRGRFGWVTFGTVHIPYILRQGEKYCAVRMVENKLLNKFLSYLHQNLYHYTNIRSYYITDAESRLLNEINMRHCDSFFGREQFTNKDLVVRLHDASEFYNFLEVCYNKLQFSMLTTTDRCGFIRINNESVVPYTVKDRVKYVPLFYFEGETDSLKLKAESLEGWDLAYLKFCCKVQGIRNELFASETCSVISLDDIKSYFPTGTQFDDYWPPKVSESQLIAKNPVQNASWTRQPAGAVPGAPTTAKTTAAHGRAFPPITPPTAGTPGAGAAASLPGGLWNSMLGQQHPNVPQQGIARMAPQALPNNQQQPRAWPTNGTTNAYYFHQQMAMQQQQQQRQQQQQAQKAQPPPLIRNRAGHPVPQHMAGNGMVSAADRTYAMQKGHAHTMPASGSGANRFNGYAPPDAMDLTAQQQAQFAMNAQMVKDPKIIQIEEVATTGQHLPYQVQKALVDSKMVPCINLDPYRYSELLMTLPDFTSHFFPGASPIKVQQILQEVLSVTLFKGNRLQTEILRQNGKCRSEKDAPALIQVRDVMSYLPQIKYVLNNKQLVQQAQNEQNKRMRIS